MERAVLHRATARAAALGLTDAEAFAGASYLITRGGTVLGALVSGRATDARLDGHEKTCFQAIVLPGITTPDVVLTVGRWPWANEDCHGIVALGLLPSRPGVVEVGILYDGAARDAGRTEPVVLAWRRGQAPEIDFAATRRSAAAGATTLAEMRRLALGKRVSAPPSP